MLTHQGLILQVPWEVLMSNPKFPSEEQGGYDPMPTSPDPLDPGRKRDSPDEPGIEELPDEGVLPLDEDEDMDPERVREGTDNALQDKQRDPR